jgi:hypothetical protein
MIPYVRLEARRGGSEGGAVVRQELNQEPSQSPDQHLAVVPWLRAGVS